MPEATETVFTVTSSNLVIGRGATREIGTHAVELGLQRVMLLTDPGVAAQPALAVAMESLRAAGIEVDLFADVVVEPTEGSFEAAASFAASSRYDGFVAVGGGSTIDTAKAANLYATHPAPFLDYVNAPIGRGAPPPGALRPLIAVPTTAGTGSETTGVAIFDLPDLHAKTGIAHRRLRPTLGIIDPDNTRTMPPAVAAASGFDVLCHALESFTALPYRQRPAPPSPDPARLPGVEPVQRRVGRAGDRDGRRSPRAGGHRSLRRRRPRGDEPRGDVRGHRIR